jgi:hypothetical protein
MIDNKNTVTETGLIDYFHKALRSTKASKANFIKVNQIAVRLGYAIHPDCCTSTVLEWLKTLTENYNATFYKEWNEIISKNRFELFVDQILHYATTYGTDFSLGNGYVPNEGSIQPEFKNLKVIEPISEKDMLEKCVSILKSGIALKTKTMQNLCDYVLWYIRIYDIDNFCKGICLVDIDEVKNKEAQAYLAVNMRKFPSDPFAILRCLMYWYTEKLLLIKNPSTIAKIKHYAKGIENLNDFDHPFSNLTEKNIEDLSRIFYRFKPLFLAMKTKRTANVVNRLRKLAKINHVPFQGGFWETVVSEEKPIDEVRSRIPELDNFRKVRILQAIKVALFSNETSKVYNIRNGKVFTRCDYAPDYNREYLIELLPIFENSLIESLSKKACRVKFSPQFNLALPSTEKSFVGNFPFGSSIRFEKNAVVGIFWKNEWGCHDFDLSFISRKGERIGWNAGYKNSNVIYSGDMTNADPYAVESMFVRNYCEDSTVFVNEYNGDPRTKFRLFFATEEMNPSDIRNHMVDPNNIRLDTMVEVDNERQKNIGLIHENTFYFMDLCSGGRSVSYYSKHEKAFIETMCDRTRCFVDLKNILLKAGFVETKEDEAPDIDFTNPEKDTIINLLSNV